jgi:hypothetical protein
MRADDRQFKSRVFCLINSLQQRPLTYRPLETSSSVSLFPQDSRVSYRIAKRAIANRSALTQNQARLSVHAH